MSRKDELLANITMKIGSIFFVLIVAIGTIKFIKTFRYKVRINRPTKTLSLDNISHSITLEELKEIEDFSDCVISGNTKQQNNNDKHIEINIDGKQFAGIKCSKKFIFCCKQLSICNFIFDISCNRPKIKQIYKELIRINGKPDKKRYNRKICQLQCNWYGNNGEIVYYKFHNKMVVIVFEVEK